jgi:hypothetical protein
MNQITTKGPNQTSKIAQPKAKTKSTLPQPQKGSIAANAMKLTLFKADLLPKAPEKKKSKGSLVDRINTHLNKQKLNNPKSKK